MSARERFSSCEIAQLLLLHCPACTRVHHLPHPTNPCLCLLYLPTAMVACSAFRVYYAYNGTISAAVFYSPCVQTHSVTKGSRVVFLVVGGVYCLLVICHVAVLHCVQCASMHTTDTTMVFKRSAKHA